MLRSNVNSFFSSNGQNSTPLEGASASQTRVFLRQNNHVRYPGFGTSLLVIF